MKNIISTFIITFITSIVPVWAQLRVDSLGQVGVGVSDTVALKSLLSIGAGGAVGAELSVENKTRSQVYTFSNPNQRCSYGIFGECATCLRANRDVGSYVSAGVRGICSYRPIEYGSGLPPVALKNIAIGLWGVGQKGNYNFGVVGNLPTQQSTGAAVFGTSFNETVATISGRYAGYFHGLTEINGDLVSTGSITCVSLTTTGNAQGGSSSALTNEDIAERLASLHATSFYMSCEEDIESIPLPDLEEEEPIQTDFFDEKSSIASQAAERVHYGLSTDQLKETFPELVYEQEDGTVGINYVEMIPLLVQTINELNKRIEVLEGKSPKKTKKQEIQAELNGVTNVTSELKSISYTLSRGTKDAEVQIFDANGRLVVCKPLSANAQQTELNVENFQNGVYLCSLVSDGKVVGTKKMVVRH